MYTQSSKRFRAIIALILAVAITASTTMIVTAISWGGNTPVTFAHTNGEPDSWAERTPEDTVSLPATLWDQRDDKLVLTAAQLTALGPQFRQTDHAESKQGLVLANLGADGLPVVQATEPRDDGNYNDNRGVWGTNNSDNTQTLAGTSTTANSPFYRWFHEAYIQTNGVIDGNKDGAGAIQLSKQISGSVNFTRTVTDGVAYYTTTYSGNSYFALDNATGTNKVTGGFSAGYNDGKTNHNFFFTMQTGSYFKFVSGQALTFEFTGDDDVWFYIDDKLVLDLGGIHGAQTATVTISATGVISISNNTYNGSGLPLTIQPGQHKWDLFYAERNPTASNLKITTTMFAESQIQKTAEAVKVNDNTIGYNYLITAKNLHPSNPLTVLGLVDWMNYTATSTGSFNSSGDFVDFGKTNGSVGKLYYSTNKDAAFPSGWQEVTVTAPTSSNSDGSVKVWDSITESYIDIVIPKSSTGYFKYFFDTAHLNRTEVGQNGYVFNKFVLLSKTSGETQATRDVSTITLQLPSEVGYDVYYHYDNVSTPAFFHETGSALPPPAAAFPIPYKIDAAGTALATALAGEGIIFNSNYYAEATSVTRSNVGSIDKTSVQNITADHNNNIIHVVFAPKPQYQVNYYYGDASTRELIYTTGAVFAAVNTPIEAFTTKDALFAALADLNPPVTLTFDDLFKTTASHKEHYNGTAWVELTGAKSVAEGTGVTIDHNTINVYFPAIPGYIVNYYYGAVAGEPFATYSSQANVDDVIAFTSDGTPTLNGTAITDGKPTLTGTALTLNQGETFNSAEYYTDGRPVWPTAVDSLTISDTAANVINVVFPPLPTYTVNYYYDAVDSGKKFHSTSASAVPGTTIPVIEDRTNTTTSTLNIPLATRVTLADYYTTATSVTRSNSISGYLVDAVTANNTISVVFTKRPTVDVTVRKTWVDNDNQDSNRDSVDFALNGLVDQTRGNLTLSNTNNESVTWSGVYKYANAISEADDRNQTPIYYTVTEILPSGLAGIYTPSGEGVNVGNVITVTNTQTEFETVDFSVKKEWIHSYEETTIDGLVYPAGSNPVVDQPQSLTVELRKTYLKDGETVDESVQTVELTAPDWDYYWTADNGTALVKNYKGNEIIYYVAEPDVANYKQVDPTDAQALEFADYSQLLVNQYDPESTSFKVSKEWLGDDSNRENKRTSIAVVLKADGIIEDDAELNATNHWTHIWNPLPRKNDGELIEYTVEEITTVSGYVAPVYTPLNSYETKITNTFGDFETVNLSVYKYWDDSDDFGTTDHSEDSINVDLFRTVNGVKTTVRTVTLNDENNWFVDFGNLPRYQTGSVGVVITYSVEEVLEDDRYVSSQVPENEDHVIEITNTPKYNVHYDLNYPTAYNAAETDTIASKLDVGYDNAGLLANESEEPALRAPADYTFLGWTHTSLPEGKDYVIATDKYSDLAGSKSVFDITLVAQWQRNVYTVKYDLNYLPSTNPDDKTGVHWDDANLETATDPTRANGWRFDGWFTAAEGGTLIYETTKYSDIAPSSETASVTLFAHWTRIYTVYYNANDGTLTHTSPLVNVEWTQSDFVSVTNPTPPTSTAGTYTFLGWYTDATNGTQVANTTAYSTLANGNENLLFVTLYARYNFNQGTTPPPIIIEETTTAAPTTTATGSTTPPALIITFVPTVPSTFTPTVPATTAQAATVPSTEPATEQYIEPTEYEEAPDNTTPLTNIIFEPDSTTPVITTEEPTTTEELAESPDNTVPQATVKIATDDKVNPQTGDNTTLLLAGIFLLAASLIGIVVFKKKIAVK